VGPQSAPVKLPRLPRLPLITTLALLGATAASAQSAAPPEPAASAPPPQRIEITGGRESDLEQRRRATAAKIVIGREEIEQYGDSTVGEVLRRLPGVTTPGTPGRGGPPRLRGLGGGYTQLLIDGEPIPRGFSLESLTPDQVERIEILRAPTAETGARAIAGTINIVLREGYRRRLNDLRAGVGLERGEASPGAFWTWNDTVNDVATNLSGALFRRSSVDRSTVESESAGGDDPGRSIEQRESNSRRLGLNAAARLQWRLGPGGDSLMLSPSLFHADNQGRSSAQLTTLSGDPRYEIALGEFDSTFTNLRLNGQWRQRLGPGRIESSLTGGSWRADSRSQRQELAGGGLLRTVDETGDIREQSLRLSGKFSALLGGDEKRADSEHSGVGGAELEFGRRTETRRLLQDGQPLLTDFGDNLAADSLRLALYAQDEWAPTPNWALHLGLRWEGIRTVGDPGDGSRPTHVDRVLTPLAHAVWKPDPASRSQVRMSLTRSWRAPGLGNLIARPRPNDRYPLDGGNTPTAPDRAGNPDLRPELATGIDLAVEHYPAGGGVFSASLFHRRISDLMRTVIALEDVPWSPVPRWVARTGNVGSATTQGLELEAKGRLDQWFAPSWANAPRTEVRASASLFRSRVDNVPGPDNRLEQQPDATLNLGADHSWRGLPLKTGFNLNWVPGYRTQTTAAELEGLSARRVVDVYGLWTFDPTLALRVTAGNAVPRDSDDFSRYDDGTFSSSTRTRTPSALNLQLRLEMKL
jgi:outer membrane receptor for ferrienterochelin and colicins